MTIVASLLVAALVVQYLLHSRERREHDRQLSKMADRIQHPEIRQVEPGPQTEYEPPKDEAELAQVGQIVPEFVQVGGE